MDMTEEYEIDFKLYESGRFAVTAMFALTPEDLETERAAILSLLKFNPNVETYIYEHLEDPVEEFFVVEKHFWDQWSTAVSFYSNAKFNLTVEHKLTIDNAAYLMLPKHKYRFKQDKSYRSDFILLPKFVFYALSRWYYCDKEIKRQVTLSRGLNVGYIRQSSVMSNQVGGSRRNSFRGSNQGFIRSGQKFYNKDLDEF
jgi:hypothetical protein